MEGSEMNKKLERILTNLRDAGCSAADLDKAEKLYLAGDIGTLVRHFRKCRCNLKIITVVMMCMALILGMAACGNTDTQNNTADRQQTEAQSNEPAAADEEKSEAKPESN